MPLESTAKISDAQFQGIWRTLKSELQTPREWTVDRSSEEIATEAMWEEMNRFTYEQVAAAARQYIESSETKFPTWGQMLARIRTKLVTDQEYPKRDTTPLGTYIARGGNRELIQMPEWEWLCETFQVDPALAFDAWEDTIKKRGRWKSIQERSTSDLEALLARCEDRLARRMLISPCGREGCNGRGWLEKNKQYCYCDLGQAKQELHGRGI